MSDDPDAIQDTKDVLNALRLRTGPFKDYSDKPDYDDLVGEFGDILLSVSEDNWQGDTWYLLQSGTRYGYLSVGWGSCSGCDALQGADTWDEVNELRDSLRSGIHWEVGPDGLMKWMQQHDWQGDYIGSASDHAQFLRQALQLLNGLAEEEKPDGGDGRGMIKGNGG